MRRMTMLMLSMLASPLAAAAQAPANTPADGLRPLARMVGRWEGTGWMMGREGRADSRVIETAEFRLGGAVLVVEGLGRADEGTPRARTVHNALGVISYDAARRVLRMRAYRSDGNQVDADVAWNDGVLEWGFEDPRAGRVRYRATIDDENWVETGEFSRDSGATWTPFFEMKLRRVR